MSTATKITVGTIALTALLVVAVMANLWLLA
jgi:hypothetical protein